MKLLLCLGISCTSITLQDDARRELLQMTESQLEDVARVCNRYPDIQLSYEIAGGGKEPVPANGSVSMQVELQREQAGDLRPVDAPRYPLSAFCLLF